MAATSELRPDGDSALRFRLRAPDGTVLAVSAAFSDKPAAVAGIAVVRGCGCAGTGLIIDRCGEGCARSRLPESATSGGPLPARQNWHRRAETFHTRAATLRRATAASRWTGAA